MSSCERKKLDLASESYFKRLYKIVMIPLNYNNLTNTQKQAIKVEQVKLLEKQTNKHKEYRPNNHIKLKI